MDILPAPATRRALESLFAAAPGRPWTGQNPLLSRLFRCAARAAFPGRLLAHSRRRDTLSRNTAAPRRAPCRAQWCAACPLEEKMCLPRSPDGSETGLRVCVLEELLGTSPCPRQALGQSALVPRAPPK